MSECLFCKIAAGEIPSKQVHADDEVVAFEDIQPQAPTHILVIPRKHVATVRDLEAGDAELAGKLVLTAQAIAARLGQSDYRLVMNCGAGAGQSVFHIHLHLLAGRPFGWPPG